MPHTRQSACLIHERNYSHDSVIFHPPRKNRSTKLTARLLVSGLCLALTLTTIPFSPTISKVRAQSEDAVQKRQRPPYRDLPDIGELLAEGRNPQPEKARPALKPSTICGYRDVVCQRIKTEKEKNKVGQAVSPGGSEQKTQIASAGKQSGGNWLQRFGRRIAGVFAGATSLSVSNSGNGSSFVPSAPRLSTGSLPTSPAVSVPVAPPSFTSEIEAKLDPHNRKGGSGEDLFSGNYHWSLPLVSLPGRNGLDLNLTLDYNSLVWIRYNNTVSFDYDYYPTLTPGFRTGFPIINGPYYVNGAWAFIATLPSGQNVELRQVYASSSENRYEAVDSSYLYLIEHIPANPSTNHDVTLYATNGTRVEFTWNGGDQWLADQIIDGNGNYITIAWKFEGSLRVIDKVIDTLGRELVFTYDGNQHLLTITQQWQNQTFTWAQFDYESRTINHNFGSLTVDGPANNTQIPVITRVITGDGARHVFVYNSWGQVNDIWTYGEADNQRAAMIYAFPGTGAPLDDCPRFSLRNDYFANWAGYNWTGWVSTYFYFKPDETEGWVTPPDGVTTKAFFNTTNGTRGLPYRSETWYGGALQKFTQTSWASDSTTSPPLRPRVTDTQICDDRNHNGTYESGTDKLSRTATSYTTLAGTVKLPYTVKEYNEGGATVYRSARADYVTQSNYMDRRLLGLPSQQRLYQGDADSGGALMAQTVFSYDSPNDGTTTFMQGHSTAPRQHDTANYGTGFLVRGNLTKVNRYSVVNGTASNPLETKTGYYYTGTVALTKDALGHTTQIHYEDLFSLGNVPTSGLKTYAYPTTVTDADGYSSAVQ